MKAELITMKADKSTAYQTAEGTELRLTIKGDGADAVIIDVKEEANTLHVHARGTGFARLTEATESGTTVGLSDPKPGEWRQGIPSDSIVTNQPTHVPDQTELEYYGGHLVCESVDPKFRPLIIAAPALLAVLQKLDSLMDFSSPITPGDPMAFQDPSAINEAMAEALEAIRQAEGGASS